MLIVWMIASYAEEMKIMKSRKYRNSLEGQRISLAGTFN